MLTIVEAKELILKANLQVDSLDLLDLLNKAECACADFLEVEDGITA